MFSCFVGTKAFWSGSERLCDIFRVLFHTSIKKYFVVASMGSWLHNCSQWVDFGIDGVLEINHWNWLRDIWQDTSREEASSHLRDLVIHIS